MAVLLNEAKDLSKIFGQQQEILRCAQNDELKIPLQISQLSALDSQLPPIPAPASFPV